MKYVLTLKAIESEVRPTREWKQLRQPYLGEDGSFAEQRKSDPQYGYVDTQARFNLDREVFQIELDDIDRTALLRAVLDVASTKA